MRPTVRNFLVLGTAIGLSLAPVAAQDRHLTTGLAVARLAPAHMGEIEAQDVESYVVQMRAAIQIKDARLRDAAITAARVELAAKTQKLITAKTITELEGGNYPLLGTTG